MIPFSSRRSMMDDNGLGGMDYEDELSGIMQGVSGSDEDTEDASEFGEDEVIHEDTQVTDIKERAYYDKLAYLKSCLAELDAGKHPDYVKKMVKIDKAYRQRIKLNEAKNDWESEAIERQFNREKRAALREFEDKKIELKDTVFAEWEDKRKHYDMERYSIELMQDTTEIKSASTRKLRRRPNDPVPLPEKRRKTPQSQITFLLDDRDIENDRDALTNIRATMPPSPKKSGGSGSSGNSNSSPPHEDNCGPPQGMKSVSPPPSSDIRIEDGKLFYEKRWFHRGQPVSVEGKDIVEKKVMGNIGAISQDTVWIRKLGDPGRFKVQLKQLISGTMSIKRRA